MIRKRSFFADATTFAAPTKEGLTDATIDQTIKRTVTWTEGAREGSRRPPATVETTKIGDQSALGASRRHSTTGTAAINVNKLRQWHRVTNKYSGASR